MRQPEFTRDPRFDRLSGKLNYDLYEKSYVFLKEAGERRREMLKGRMARTKRKEEKERIREAYEAETRHKGKSEALSREKTLKREEKKRNKERAKKGLAPVYKKKE